MKTFRTATFSLLLCNLLYGQTTQTVTTTTLAVDILTKKAVKVGDTISFRIRNLSSSKRRFTIEATSSKTSPYYENAVYSAFFNRDSVFSKNLKISQQLSKKEKLPYVLPDYVLHAHEVEGNSEQYFSYIVRGTPIKKKVLIRLRITSGIVAEKEEITYSRPLPVFVIPD